jgi:chromosome segregation ATPase
MPVNYRELTKAEGVASLLISDRVEKPFDAQIIFDFCPPGKRHGVDLEMLSGGEKTMAALAFVFAMAQVIRPGLLVLDEVDAFLDGDNVEQISTFLQKKLNLFSKPAGFPT